MTETLTRSQREKKEKIGKKDHPERRDLSYVTTVVKKAAPLQCAPSLRLRDQKVTDLEETEEVAVVTEEEEVMTSQEAPEDPVRVEAEEEERDVPEVVLVRKPKSE
jgi:hypothetical protein